MALETNDFLGSFADENVRFTTEVVKTSTYGDQYMKTIVFVEDNRFVDNTGTDWVSIPGAPTGSTMKALVVTASTYAQYTSGILRSWLYDLFINGSVYDCILATFGTIATVDTTDPDNPVTVAGTATEDNLEACYNLMKMYGYHKTVCAGAEDHVTAELALKLAKLCKEDAEFISSAPYFPCTSVSPTSDAIYAAIYAEAAADAMMVYHADTTHNGALYLLGLALADASNKSGTPIGNTLNMQKSSNITASGEGGTTPTSAVKSALDSANIGYFKPVGDNSGAVACEEGDTIKGNSIPAAWIRAYITYMAKVDIARLITVRNFKRKNSNYLRIIQVLKDRVSAFDDILDNIVISAPAFSELSKYSTSKRVIAVPNAWSASFTDVVHEVRISGTMYIGE